MCVVLVFSGLAITVVRQKIIITNTFCDLILQWNLCGDRKANFSIGFILFLCNTTFIVREQVYSRGKLVLKASHWSRYVEGTLVNMKNVVGNFVTCTGTIHRGLKRVSYNISMETRLHLKSSLFPLICQYFITKL